MLEIRRSFSPELPYNHIIVDHHAAWRVSSEQDAVSHLLDLGIKITTFECRRHACRLKSLHLSEGPVRYVQLEVWAAGEYFLRIDFGVPIHELKHIAEHPDCFRRSEHQIAAGVERVVKEGESAFLQLYAEINENIPATNQIEP